MSQRRLELTAAVLLAVATIATAWSAYQARQWTGRQASETSRATATRIAANRAAALANRQVQIDLATFIQWVDARQERRTGLDRFYRARFRDEFKPAFASWLATKPFDSRSAPATPFVMPQYRLEASNEADRLEAAAAVDSERAKDANERAGSYMLAVVLFATSLFFTGISTKLETAGVRHAMLGLGCVVLLGGLVWVATFPVELTRIG